MQYGFENTLCFFGQPLTMNRRPFGKYVIEHGCEKLTAVALELAQYHENLLSDTDCVCNEKWRDYKIAMGWTMVWRALNKDATIQIIDNEIRMIYEKRECAAGVFCKKYRELQPIIDDFRSLFTEINGCIIITPLDMLDCKEKPVIDTLFDKLKFYPSEPLRFLQENGLTLEARKYFEGLLYKMGDESGFGRSWVKPKKLTAYARHLDLITAKFSEFEKCFEDAKKAKKDAIRHDDELKAYSQQADRWWEDITKNAPLMDSHFNAFQQIEDALNPNLS